MVAREWPDADNAERVVLAGGMDRSHTWYVTVQCHKGCGIVQCHSEAVVVGSEFYRPMLTVGQLGMEVRRLRVAAGLTQAELADRAGVSRRWLGQMERGHLRAETDKVMRVVRALGLAVRFEPARAP